MRVWAKNWGRERGREHKSWVEHETVRASGEKEVRETTANGSERKGAGAGERAREREKGRGRGRGTEEIWC